MAARKPADDGETVVLKAPNGAQVRVPSEKAERLLTAGYTKPTRTAAKPDPATKPDPVQPE